MNFPFSSTGCTIGILYFRQTTLSSSPKAGAVWTIPVPSSAVTKSAVKNWNEFSLSLKYGNNGSYFLPSNSFPVTSFVIVYSSSDL